MEKSAKRKRRHHYVQARYLDGFLADGDDHLWCYGRKRDRAHRSTPDNLAHQRDFYALPSNPGNNLEDYLQKYVEDPGLQALRSLLKVRAAPALDSRVHLAKYIAFQEMRVPYMREQIRAQALHSVKQTLETFDRLGVDEAQHKIFATSHGKAVMSSEFSKISRSEVAEYLAFLEANPETFDLEMMNDLALDAMGYYSQMKWTVFYAENGLSYITSDAPVFRIFEDKSNLDDAFLRKDCKIVCPLSKSALLVMSHDVDPVPRRSTFVAAGGVLPSTDFVTADEEDMNRFNTLIAQNAHLWCFSDHERVTLIEALNGRSRRAVITTFSNNNISGASWTLPPL